MSARARARVCVHNNLGCLSCVTRLRALVYMRRTASGGRSLDSSGDCQQDAVSLVGLIGDYRCSTVRHEEAAG